MAKYTYTDSNDILFNNLDSNPSPKFSIGGKIYNSQNKFQYANEDGIEPVVNAVEIDWNGAQLSLPEELNWGTTINLLLAECIWSLETILNEKCTSRRGCTFAAKKGQHLF